MKRASQILRGLGFRAEGFRAMHLLLLLRNLLVTLHPEPKSRWPLQAVARKNTPNLARLNALIILSIYWSQGIYWGYNICNMGNTVYGSFRKVRGTFLASPQ